MTLIPTMILLAFCPVVRGARPCSVGYSCGQISWYGRESARHRMANGSQFNWNRMTAASYAYPLGTKLEITNLENGRKVVVEVTDRGPAKYLNRLLDVSEAASKRLGFHQTGVVEASVFVRKYKSSLRRTDSQSSDARFESKPGENQ